MYRYSLLFLTLFFLIISCNKDDNGSTSEEQEADSGFFALEVGNKWAYHYFRRDNETGELTNVGALEEVEITGEEVINGETLYTVQINTSDPNNTCPICNNDPMLTTKVKDSLGYLVEVGGPIKFSSENTEDYIITDEEWGTVYRVLEPNEVQITVPVGQFVCKSNLRYAILPNGERSEGQDNLFYADGIGEVRQTFSTVNSLRILYEKHLVSYSVQ